MINQSERLGVSGNVIFLGERPKEEIPGLLLSFKIFIFPTLWEGLSTALMEAMVMGLPIIASDIDENKELIIHKKNGILIPIKNSEAMKEAVTALLSDEQLRISIGKQAQTDSKKFYGNQRTQMTINLYTQLIAEKILYENFNTK